MLFSDFDISQIDHIQLLSQCESNFFICLNCVIQKAVMSSDMFVELAFRYFHTFTLHEIVFLFLISNIRFVIEMMHIHTTGLKFLRMQVVLTGALKSSLFTILRGSGSLQISLVGQLNHSGMLAMQLEKRSMRSQMQMRAIIAVKAEFLPDGQPMNFHFQ